MAAVSITAANVQHSAAAENRHGIAASAITAGQAVYKTASGTIDLADADSSTTTAAAVGIANNSCAAGQPVGYTVKDSAFAIGGTVVIGESYFAGPTAGEIIPAGDLASGDYMTLLGIGTTTSVIHLDPVVTGIDHGA